MEKRAFSSNLAIFEYRASGIMPDFTLDEHFSQQCGKDINACISRMLKVIPAARPTAAELIDSFAGLLQTTRPKSETSVHIRHNFQISELPAQFTSSLQFSTSTTAVTLPSPLEQPKLDLSVASWERTQHEKLLVVALAHSGLLPTKRFKWCD